MNILITGGASGLGLALTSRLLEDKTNFIYFTYCNSLSSAKKLETQHQNTKGIFCDFGDENSLNQLLAQMESLNLNVLINNAFSVLNISHFHKVDDSGFSDSFEKNILPTVKIMQKSVLLFRKKKAGKIITILSSHILNKPQVGLSKYIAEKNYLLSICKSIAVENSAFKITSNSVSPSFMLTKLTENTDERVIEDMKKKHPLKNLLTTKETADVVYYVVNASQQINGHNFIINAAENLV